MRLGLGVEARGGFVEDEDARIGQDGAGDGESLALAAAEFYAALADDGVVSVGKAFGELIDPGDAAGFENLLLAGKRPGECDVLANRAIEEKRVLQAPLRAGCGSCPAGPWRDRRHRPAPARIAAYERPPAAR